MKTLLQLTLGTVLLSSLAAADRVPLPDYDQRYKAATTLGDGLVFDLMEDLRARRIEAEALRTENVALKAEIVRLKDESPNKPFALYLDCGSFLPWTDPSGRAWLADPISDGRISLSPAPTVKPAEEATLSPLYRTERIGAKLTYTLDVPAGNYRVTLRFREAYYSAAGRRVFSVTINGVITEPALDIFATTGGKNIALVKTAETVVGADRKLVIEFNKGVADIPSICALSVERIP